MATQGDLSEAVQQFISGTTDSSKNKLTVTREKKDACKVQPKAGFEMSLLADVWFRRFCEFAKSRKATVELRARVITGGGGGRFMGRTRYSQTSSGHVTFTEPGDLNSWEYEDFSRVTSWYFLIQPQ